MRRFDSPSTHCTRKKKNTIMSTRIHRRKFLGCAATGAAGLTILRNSASVWGAPANTKLNIAMIGVGGRGRELLGGFVQAGNVVAMCDVNDQRAAKAYESVPAAKKFHDFRRDVRQDGQANRRGRGGHARPHPRRGLGRRHPRRQARLHREASDAHGPRVADAPRVGQEVQGGHVDGQPGHVQRPVPPGLGTDPRRGHRPDQGSPHVERPGRGRPQERARKARRRSRRT